MKNTLLTGLVIALVLFIGGLFVMANPEKAAPKPDAEKKAESETKAPEAEKKPEAATDPKKALADAFAKMSKSTGYHFSGERVTQYIEMGMTTPETFEGVKNNTDKMLYTLLKKSVMGAEKQTAFYLKGEKRFASVIGTGERVDATTYPPLLQAERFVKDGLKDFTFGEDEQLEEVDHATIEAVVKDEAAGKLMAELPPMGALPPKSKITGCEGSFKVWVNKETGLVAKISFAVEVAAKVEGEENESGRKITVDMTVSNYDTDIEIKLPEDAKKFFEGKSEAKPDGKSEKKPEMPKKK